MFGTTVLARVEDGAQREVAPAPVVCRGIRGAILAEANTADAILEATRALLCALVEANGVEPVRQPHPVSRSS